MNTDSEESYHQRYNKAGSLEAKGKVLLEYLRAHPDEAVHSPWVTGIIGLMPYLADNKRRPLHSTNRRMKITNGQREIIDSAHLTRLQEETVYLRLQGLALTKIARKLGCHHSTVQERLKAAAKKIERVKSRKNWFS